MALVGGFLALILIESTLEAYFGVSPLAKLESAFPSPIPRQPLGDQGSAVVFYTGQARFPAEDTRVLDGTAQPLQLDRGTLALDGLGDLVRTNSDGTATKLTGLEGQRIHVSNLGAWDASNGRLSGLDAAYEAGRWVINDAAMHPVNPNAQLQIHDANGHPTDFWVSPGDAHYGLSWSNDGQGPFAHIQATGANPYLVLNSRIPLNELDGVPVTVRGEIRARCSCVTRLTIYDVVSASGAAQTFQVEGEHGGSWVTLTATVPRVQYPNDGDNFSLGLFNLGSGDSFDVRSLSVFVGVVP